MRKISRKRLVTFLLLLVVFMSIQTWYLLSKATTSTTTTSTSTSTGTVGSKKQSTLEEYKSGRRGKKIDTMTNHGTAGSTTTNLLINNTTSITSRPISKLIHVTVYGLGHRLCRASAAWHFAQHLNLTHMKFQWNTCGETHATGTPIFPFLFGQDEWSLPTTHRHSATATATATTFSGPSSPVDGKSVLVRNDVYGYVPGQGLKNFHVPLPSHLYKQRNNGPFLEKLQYSDVNFYQQVQDRYVFYKEEVVTYMKDNDFHQHTVIGLHVRAGNGEETHFTDSGRMIANQTVFVSNLIRLVQEFVEKQHYSTKDNKKPSPPSSFPSSTTAVKPPLIFLATDTASLIPTIVEATETLFGIKTIVLPQLRLAENQGVTFSALKGKDEKCLLGWKAMVSDMLLLGHADVLIAARYSSFTQSLPMSLVFDRKGHIPGPHYCEVSLNGTSMTCLQDLSTWLFRDDGNKTFHYTIVKDNNIVDDDVVNDRRSTQRVSKPMNSHSHSHLQSHHVVHKMVIQLPDIQPAKSYNDLIQFLHSPIPNNNKNDNDNDNPSSLIYTYGKKRYNPRYREKHENNHILVRSFNITT